MHQSCCTDPRRKKRKTKHIYKVAVCVCIYVKSTFYGISSSNQVCMRTAIVSIFSFFSFSLSRHRHKQQCNKQCVMKYRWKSGKLSHVQCAQCNVNSINGWWIKFASYFVKCTEMNKRREKKAQHKKEYRSQVKREKNGDRR